MPWDEVLSKFKAGTLRSGGSGAPVTDKDQALAIMYSEKREAEGGKAEYRSRRRPTRVKPRRKVQVAPRHR